MTWRHPEQSTCRAVGVLERSADGYEFAYLPGIAAVPDFQPFLGFSDPDRRYRSSPFPLFAERVMDPARPDRPRWLESLGLERDPDVMEVLARSGGRRAGDTIELFAEPVISAEGRTSCTFLTHGARRQEGASELIDVLRPGDRLLLVDQPDNSVTSLAIRVADAASRPLRWVTDPLLDYVHEVRRGGGHRLTVVRANPPEVGPICGCWSCWRATSTRRTDRSPSRRPPRRRAGHTADRAAAHARCVNAGRGHDRRPSRRHPQQVLPHLPRPTGRAATTSSTSLVSIARRAAQRQGWTRRQ